MDNTPWGHAENLAKKAFELYGNAEFSESLSQLEKAIEINPYNNGSLFFNQGLALDAMERFEEAIEAFEHASKLDPKDLETLNSLAVDYTRICEYGKALETFEEIQRMDPDFHASYCNRIVLYTEMENHDKADVMFYIGIQTGEECPVCYYNIGNSLMVRGNYKKAIYCWEKTKSLEPTHPQINYRIGQAYWAIGDTNKAKEYFQEEIRNNKANPEVNLSYSLLRIEMGKVDEVQELERIIELDPENEYAHYYLAEAHMRKGNIDNAIDNFTEALRSDSETEGAYYRLGQCYLQKGEKRKALDLLSREDIKNLDNPEMLLDLGALLYELGSMDKAANCFLQIVGDSPKEHTAEQEEYRAYHNLSCCLYRDNEFEGGIQLSEHALNLNPKHLPSLQNLVHAHLYRGELEKAQRYIERAHESLQNSDEVKYLKRELIFPKLKNRIKSSIETAHEYLQNRKEVKYLKRKIMFPKLENIIRRIPKRFVGSKSGEIAKRMEKIMQIEHGNVARYSTKHINVGKLEKKRSGLLPPLMVKKMAWREK